MDIPEFLQYFPTVYAVRDRYEIIFLTKEAGAGEVVVNGIRYTDNVCGVVRSGRQIHRVSIRADVLNSAAGYTVVFRSIPERKPYFPQTASTMSAGFCFRPVPESEDIHCYILADTHSHVTAPTKAGSYFDEQLNLLILCGDIGNTATDEKSVLTVARLSSNLAKGEIPVLYLRGNHDTRGAFAEYLPDYVGTDHGRTYYPFRLGRLWGVVLDAGEDKPDTNKEYGDTADFAPFRDAQTEMLKELIDRAATEYEAKDVQVRLALCHIPFPVVETPFAQVYDRWTEQLNRIGIHLFLGGHNHYLRFLPAGESIGGSNLHNFPASICARIDRSDLDTYAGTAMIIRKNEILLRYTDIHHQVLEEHTVPIEIK